MQGCSLCPCGAVWWHQTGVSLQLTNRSAVGQPRSCCVMLQTWMCICTIMFDKLACQPLQQHTLIMRACLSSPSQRLYGSAEGLLAAQRNPTTPLDRVLHHGKEAAARVAYLNSLKEEHKGNPYMDYALTREGEFHADPANIAHEELLLPKVGGLLYVCVWGGGGRGRQGRF